MEMKHGNETKAQALLTERSAGGLYPTFNCKHIFAQPCAMHACYKQMPPDSLQIRQFQVLRRELYLPNCLLGVLYAFGLADGARRPQRMTKLHSPH